jgi:hypothetical protein
MTPVYVVSDVHGHPDKLLAALTETGLTDADGAWAGRDVRLWVLGDFFDRGPDGVGVVDLVRRLQAEASASQGEVHALLGNHEILALGMKRFGMREVSHDGVRPRSFEISWVLNGGRESDQERLTDDHVAWLSDLPLLGLDDDHLLMHSDTVEYLRWGNTVEEINASIRRDLGSDDIEVWWEIWRRMTTRYAFRGFDGARVADAVMQRLGGRRIVHGHSIVADMLGIEPEEVPGPVLYADGRVLAVDGGCFAGGPLLMVPLPPV